MVPFDFRGGPSELYRFLRILAQPKSYGRKSESRPLQRPKVGALKFGRNSVNCLIRNLSITGAAIDLSSRTELPERFVLVVPGDRLQLPCHTVWRKEHRIGVVFK